MVERVSRYGGLLLLGCLWAAQASAVTGKVRELDWEDLMPADWNPEAVLETALDGRQAGDLMDGSAEANRLLAEYTTAMSAAPVIEDLDGQQVRLAGFVLPLEFGGFEVTEFLLVPYFGACIHVPPPPANQIVYVKTQTAYPITGMFDAVRVTGTLKVESYRNLLGDAGYTMVVERIEPHE
jgi:hypothetical protein